MGGRIVSPQFRIGTPISYILLLGTVQRSGSQGRNELMKKYTVIGRYFIERMFLICRRRKSSNVVNLVNVLIQIICGIHLCYYAVTDSQGRLPLYSNMKPLRICWVSKYLYICVSYNTNFPTFKFSAIFTNDVQLISSNKLQSVLLLSVHSFGVTPRELCVPIKECFCNRQR